MEPTTYSASTVTVRFHKPLRHDISYHACNNGQCLDTDDNRDLYQNQDLMGHIGSAINTSIVGGTYCE